MTLAHIGLGVFVIGVTLTSTYSVEKDLRMAPGDTYEIDGYTFRFDGISQQRGPNYLSDTGTITVLRGAQQHGVLNPEKRVYLVQQMPITEASIDAGHSRDLYLALVEPLVAGAS